MDSNIPSQSIQSETQNIPDQQVETSLKQYKSRRLLVLLSLIILVAISIGVCFFLFNKKNDQKKNQQNVSSTPTISPTITSKKDNETSVRKAKKTEFKNIILGERDYVFNSDENSVDVYTVATTSSVPVIWASFQDDKNKFKIDIPSEWVKSILKGDLGSQTYLFEPPGTIPEDFEKKVIRAPGIYENISFNYSNALDDSPCLGLVPSEEVPSYEKNVKINGNDILIYSLSGGPMQSLCATVTHRNNKGNDYFFLRATKIPTDADDLFYIFQQMLESLTYY
jgi:hypothetical protein